jgi:hypothetical protein
MHLRACACMHLRACACAYMRVRACVRVHVHVRMRVCVRVRACAGENISTGGAIMPPGTRGRKRLRHVRPGRDGARAAPPSFCHTFLTSSLPCMRLLSLPVCAFSPSRACASSIALHPSLRNTMTSSVRNVTQPPRPLISPTQHGGLPGTTAYPGRWPDLTSKPHCFDQ